MTFKTIKCNHQTDLSRKTPHSDAVAWESWTEDSSSCYLVACPHSSLFISYTTWSLSKNMPAVGSSHPRSSTFRVSAQLQKPKCFSVWLLFRANSDHFQESERTFSIITAKCGLRAALFQPLLKHLHMGKFSHDLCWCFCFHVVSDLSHSQN